MNQKRVLYIVSRETDGKIYLDGGLETNRPGAPVADSVRQAAIEQVPDVLRGRPDDLNELF